MFTRNIASIAVAITAIGLGTLALPGIATAQNAATAQNGMTAQDVAAQIEMVRQATLKYTDVKVALAEGFVPAPPGACIDAGHEGLPPQWGGMGIHYINPKLLKITQGQPRVDGQGTHTDFGNPAILLYEPQADGGLKLVGAENLVFMHAWQKTGQHAPPMFAGRIWDTMADNSSTKQDEAHAFEPHHDQHVYFQKMDNPRDQLKPFSPNVTCKHDKMRGAGMKNPGGMMKSGGMKK